ncbi:hypothetical protein D9756_007027 [Leucocoprinus leucothites]|uniref:Uncharacterized protein n=1 Tax=Leucocoprinus leucothites TaxID=201217 RepID=A0A8H5D601_9AGAR|nr:hypothetical protein D9756_007027 [Leucoagaricus leucothites]
MATKEPTRSPSGLPSLGWGHSPDVEKSKDDVWSSNPPQVTSFIACPRSSPHSGVPSPRPGAPSPDPATTYTSPICGFGWQFRLNESYHYQTSKGNALVQELVGRRALSFQPHMCSSMPLRSVKVTVKASYPDALDTSNSSHERVFSNVAIRTSDEGDIGTYDEPPQYRGRTHFQITITFDPSDKLSLPNSSSTNTKKALRCSLDALSFIDTKFYLFSRRVNSRPACPKVVYAKSELLETSSPFLKDLLSEGTGFSSGSPCDLSEDVPEELNKLDEGAFEYDSDSDLEDGEPEVVGKGKEKGSGSEEKLEIVSTQVDDKLANQHPVNGRAFAINGTAYKTWKAFIYYTYTGDIVFNRLKSGEGSVISRPVAKKDLDGVNPVSCSPKSMYRFADYADIPALKSLAKEGIRKSLSSSNIVDELFSSFTYKYQEVIELEVDFLVANFTPGVARRLDEMLEMIVLGGRPRSFRVLAFAMRRLRGGSKEEAWNALDSPARGKKKKGKAPFSTWGKAPHGPPPSTPGN